MQQQAKLVAAPARYRIARTHATAEAFGGLPEQAVAGVVAEAVVDFLELVEVDEQHRRHLLVAIRHLHRLLQAVDEKAAIRQAREIVVISQEVEPVGGFFLFGDIENHRNEHRRLFIG